MQDTEYSDGWYAYLHGAALDECPYPFPSTEGSEWSRGWHAASRWVDEQYNKEPS
jgi:ribosome modulation factor